MPCTHGTQRRIQHYPSVTYYPSIPPQLSAGSTHVQWTTDMNGKQTLGLTQAAAITEERCAETCCGDPHCETYQYCNSSACGSGPPQQGSCWIGKVTGSKSQPSAGWVGKARTVAPGPSPSPNGTTSCTEEWCRVTTDDSKWRTVDVPHDVRRC